MIRKNKPSLSYLNCSINRSPSKEAHSFSKAQRFIEKKRFSPDKFYDIPDGLNKRGAGIGFGNRVDIVLKQLNDPAKYHLKSEFGGPNNKSITRTKPENRSPLKRNNSYVLLRHPTDTSFQNNQSCQKKQLKKFIYDGSPVKKQDKLKIQQKPRFKSYIEFENNQNIKQRKSANQMKYQCTQKNLNTKSKTSYTQFLMPRSRQRHGRQKTQEEISYIQNKLDKFDIVQQRISPKHQKMEKQRLKEDPRSRVGPGSYNIFSQFGPKGRFI